MYQSTEISSLKRDWIAFNSNIPRRFYGYEPKDIEKTLGKFPLVIEEWLESALAGEVIMRNGGLGSTGVGLLMDGGPGLGKTTHAVVTAMEFLRRLPDDADSAREILKVHADNYNHRFRPIYFLTFPEFLSRKKALFEADSEVKPRLFQEMEGFHGRSSDDALNVRILVLDDLGKEYGSDYNDSSFDEILRSRYDKALPTIVTTNVERERWGRQYSEAMGSFAYEAFHRVELLGKDLRKG